MSDPISVPGKAVLAGEYAVLWRGQGLVCAVDRYLVCKAERAPRDTVSALGLRWAEGEPELAEFRFVRAAVAQARAHLVERGLEPVPLTLQLTDMLREPDGTKLGLGGSAASVVAAFRAVLSVSGVEADNARVYALAASAHARAQIKRGSGLDVAASTFGGVLLAARFVEGAPPPEIVRLPPWPGDATPFALVFSGRSASTPSLLGAVDAYAKREPGHFAVFLDRSHAACARLAEAIRRQDWSEATEAVRLAGDALDDLGERSSIPIAIDAHRALARRARAAGLAAKVSGAGGGDCSLVAGDPAKIRAFLSDCAARGERAFPLRLATSPSP